MFHVEEPRRTQHRSMLIKWQTDHFIRTASSEVVWSNKF